MERLTYFRRKHRKEVDEIGENLVAIRLVWCLNLDGDNENETRRARISNYKILLDLNEPLDSNF
jgi:hypothetical protein